MPLHCCRDIDGNRRTVLSKGFEKEMYKSGHLCRFPTLFKSTMKASQAVRRVGSARLSAFRCIPSAMHHWVSGSRGPFLILCAHSDSFFHPTMPSRLSRLAFAACYPLHQARGPASATCGGPSDRLRPGCRPAGCPRREQVASPAATT